MLLANVREVLYKKYLYRQALMSEYKLYTRDLRT